MTGGTAAGLLLSNLLMDHASEEESDLFDPNRMDARSVPSLAKYNGVVASHLVADMTRAAVDHGEVLHGPAVQPLGRVDPPSG